jgi:prefoldin subunit 5
MMEGMAFADLVTKYGIVFAVGIYALSFIVPRMFKARTEVADANLQTAHITARTDIIEILQARMNALETEQNNLRWALDTERDKRLEAEDMVDALARENEYLKRRVEDLEKRLRAMGQEPA